MPLLCQWLLVFVAASRRKCAFFVGCNGYERGPKAVRQTNYGNSLPRRTDAEVPPFFDGAKWKCDPPAVVRPRKESLPRS